ncbi:ankyrin repeat-containing domain protein [Coprinopsis sp. MPI-PUGE-AT-0042]|nr:ankyrin repeat-containing domain protein [Coprinopsis sp. MPI-PUGE-AT-0042]
MADVSNESREELSGVAMLESAQCSYGLNHEGQCTGPWRWRSVGANCDNNNFHFLGAVGGSLSSSATTRNNLAGLIQRHPPQDVGNAVGGVKVKFISVAAKAGGNRLADPEQTNDTDIDLHIEKGINDNAELQRLLLDNPSLRKEIFLTIKKNCGGMFLHASLQLDALRGCPSRQDDVYRHTWARISNQSLKYAALAKAVLAWVLYASRSMTMEELKWAVATSPSNHKFEAGRLVPETTLLAICGGLITVEEESGLVRLVHYTAKDTLEGLLHEEFPHPHSLLAAVCMTHLAECGFQNTTINTRQEFRAALKRDPLLAYASEAWAFHAHSELDVEETKCRTAQFIAGSHAFPAFTNSDRTFDFDTLTPLHILAVYDLPLALIDDTTNPNLRTKAKQQSALIIASQFGHEGLVASLLALSEIQVNLVASNGWSALTMAAGYGREGTVKLLLAHPEIQVNLVASNGWSALMLAAMQGHEGSVELLLAHPEIQVNLVASNGWSALTMAAGYGREGTVKLLLAHPEIQVNLADSEGASSLMLAARNGHEGSVELLLAHPEIQVNLVASNGWSALTMAARNGHEGAVKLLLAHPEIQDNLVANNGCSALIAAAQNGHEGTVKLLLAHPEIQDNLVANNGCSALIAAAQNGHEGAVKLLLAHPEIQDNLVANNGCSALIAAAQNGHEGTVKLLLAHPEIQVNLVANNGWSALMMAASGCGRDAERTSRNAWSMLGGGTRREVEVNDNGLIGNESRYNARMCTPSNPLRNYATLSVVAYGLPVPPRAAKALLAELPRLACLPLSHGVDQEQEAYWTASQRSSSKLDWLSSTCDPSLEKEALLVSLGENENVRWVLRWGLYIGTMC